MLHVAIGSLNGCLLRAGTMKLTKANNQNKKAC
jgi:hypothetical protein